MGTQKVDLTLSHRGQSETDFIDEYGASVQLLLGIETF